MFASYLARRAFLARSLGATALSATIPSASRAASSLQETSAGWEPLDTFIARYLRAMNAPGITLALANRDGTVRTAAFGYDDLETKTPVTTDLMFETGSITKSFVALTLLQLRDQGKLEVNRPILEYLPWLPIEANYGVITVHHLLTHTSGLPDALGLFLTDPHGRHVQGFKPGEHFHYCNVGFAILGYLIQSIERRPWPDSIRARIFEPLGMNSSSAVITNRTRDRRPKSYVPFSNDLVYLRQGRLAQAANLTFEDAAGSVESTPGDMALYIRMLLRGGQGPNGRIVSEESFGLFTKPNIKAPDLSPTASYGYGIGVDQLDGHRILRHTGGMTSFASAMHIDLDGGVAAWASVNAMQGYRPNPVTQFAVQVMNAQAQHKPVPAPPQLTDPAVVKNASEYAGVYTSSDGRKIEIAANGDRVTMQAGSQSFPLELAGGDAFLATVGEWQEYPILFDRAHGAAGGNGDKEPPVVELMYGPDWYTNDRYSGPRSYPNPADLDKFSGRYATDDPWVGGVRIVVRKGQLWLEGATPLERLGGALFRMSAEPHNPDTAEFFYEVDGKMQLLKLNGADLWRLSAA